MLRFAIEKRQARHAIEPDSRLRQPAISTRDCDYERTAVPATAGSVGDTRRLCWRHTQTLLETHHNH